MTPFRRAVDAALIDQHRLAARSKTVADVQIEVDKWQVLRTLTAARLDFGLSDRSLTVLQALLSFYPEREISGAPGKAVVFPSNTALCERLNGMACSTMRRHLAVLVDTGLVLRRDSPNGKRYVRRSRGQIRQAFGFDLSPLATRFDEISNKAEAAKIATEKLGQIRRDVSLMLRDLHGLVTYGRTTLPDHIAWDALSDRARLTARTLRRQLSLTDLEMLERQMAKALDQVCDLLKIAPPTEMSTSDGQNEQHIQSSEKDTDITKNDPAVSNHPQPMIPGSHVSNIPKIPLDLVLQTCSEIRTYVPDKIRHWPDLIRAAEKVSAMMGISSQIWAKAIRNMGPERTAVVVLAILERFDHIRSAGAYLTHLAQKFQRGDFRCEPMVLALAGHRATKSSQL